MAAPSNNTHELIARLRAMSPEQIVSLCQSDDKAEAVFDDSYYQKLDELCSKSPLFWLRKHTKTNNPQYLKLGLPYQAPFPFKPHPGYTYDYFDVLFRYFVSESHLFVPKTRDMMTTLSVMGYAAHRAQWSREETIVQTANEEKAKELVTMAANYWTNQDDFLKERHPITSRSALLIEWADGGKVRGIPKGEDQIRMFHPSRYVQDESAFLPEAAQCYDAAHPVCPQIICISSAGPGWFAAQCSR